MLEKHCCGHFMEELAEQFSGIMENMKCGLCNSVFKKKHALLLHIGVKHGKINVILKEKGFKVLPAPLVNTINGARQKEMQHRLMEIKMEKEAVVTSSPGQAGGASKVTVTGSLPAGLGRGQVIRQNTVRNISDPEFKALLSKQPGVKVRQRQSGPH